MGIDFCVKGASSHRIATVSGNQEELCSGGGLASGKFSTEGGVINFQPVVYKSLGIYGPHSP